MVLNGSPAGLAEASGRVWTFAGREFDESRLELRVNGTPVELELKPLEILVQLLLHAGEVVTKDQLLEAVWPGLSVVEGSLTTAVHKLRKALGDDDSSMIVTVPRVGYRLAAVAQSSYSRKSTFPTKLTLQAGQPVPGRAHWCLARPLDASSNSEVWLAEHPKTRELRVFKFVSDASRLAALKREVTVFRFLRESLGERSDFVRIFEWNFDQHPYFLESEYGGPNLAQWAENQGGLANVPMQNRLRMVANIAQTVAAAHAAGVLHKDLKPSNILITAAADSTWCIKLADFGSASLVEPSRLKALGITSLGLTQTGVPSNGSITGTLAYLAPEVLSGNPPTALADVYALGVILYQSVIGDFCKPISLGWEDQVEDPLIREDIAAAACGDPARRLKTAAELAERLRILEERRSERNRLEQERQRTQLDQRRRAEARVRRPWIALATIAALVLASTLYLHRQSSPSSSSVKSVAVIPFQNAGPDHSLDFLSLALADEVSTSLSYTRGLTIRPLAADGDYMKSRPNLQKLGREMKVKNIVAGRFLREGDQLQLTLEAVDVEGDRVLWLDTFQVPAQGMIELREKIVARTQGPLAAALGASSLTAESGTHPKNEEAYGLYLRSTALPYDADRNTPIIAMLEKSVGLDPFFAPAWYELSRRYYVASRYADAGHDTVERYEIAAVRAVALDPNYIAAAAFLANSYVERGELIKALQQDEDLVRRRPDSFQAHFSRSYVLRYAGLLKESASECEISLSLAPSDVPRSCAIVFFLQGDYQHAMQFIRLGPASDFADAMSIAILLRQGRKEEALRIELPHIPQWGSYDMLPACAQHKPSPEIAALAANVRTSDDPEANYLAAANLAYCGQTTQAIRLLRLAIQGNYCSYPAIDSDPFFASVRAKPEFAEIRSAAIACQKNFLTERQRLQGSLSPISLGKVVEPGGAGPR
jgi:DNA-binding winged helix-turn-helix (wHTH) protein/serine/threonine protein kinase